ncbi:MAG TPA: hypothetical protein VLF62_00825 [Candidatus Saccharimonadales bacterium]|nr:hypothetical protein [Candidatus Saccharimonadales bacterium]
MLPPRQQPAREQHRPEPQHRRPGIVRKLASFVLNGGRRQTGRHAATLGNPATAPAAAHMQPVAKAPAAPVHHAPERRAPAPTHLHYNPGIAEGTKSHDVVPVGTHQPLLNRDQVNQQLGFEAFGDLQAVVHLPGATEPLYAFKSTKDLGKGNVQVDYRFATPKQLDQMRSSVNTPAWDEVYEGMMHLNRINNGETVVGTGGTTMTIGRDYWLPGRPGKEHTTDPHTNVPEGMENVAPAQLRFRIDDTNSLVALNLSTPYDYRMDSDAKNAQPPAIVELNPAVIAPQDEWPRVPINHLQGTTSFPTTLTPV